MKIMNLSLTVGDEMHLFMSLFPIDFGIFCVFEEMKRKRERCFELILTRNDLIVLSLSSGAAT